MTNNYFNSWWFHLFFHFAKQFDACLEKHKTFILPCFEDKWQGVTKTFGLQNVHTRNRACKSSLNHFMICSPQIWHIQHRLQHGSWQSQTTTGSDYIVPVEGKQDASQNVCQPTTNNWNQCFGSDPSVFSSILELLHTICTTAITPISPFPILADRQWVPER